MNNVAILPCETQK